MKGILSRAIFGIALLLIVSSGWGQNLPPLRIDSPPDGTVVHPGDTVTIVVSSPSGAVANGVAVLGEEGIAGAEIAGRLPARIPVSIPADISPGHYKLSAMSLGGNQVYASIEVDVEMPDHPAPTSGGGNPGTMQRLTADSSIILASQGQKMRIRAIANYSNGAQVDVTESSKLMFRSLNASVATVNSDGTVTAVAPGKAPVTLTYVEGGKSFQATVPVTVEAEIVIAVPSALYFGGDRGVQVGTGVSQQVVLTYQTNNPSVKILNVKATGDYSQRNDCVSSSATRTEKTCTISVTFSPTGTGSRRGELTILDSWGSAPTTIPLMGQATDR